MKLWLARHTEPSWFDQDGKTINNPGLSGRGKEEAVKLAALVDGFPISHWWTSRQRRATQTARYIGDGFEKIAAFNELTQPPWWQGLDSLEPVREELDKFMRKSRHDKWGGFEDGEDIHLFIERVTRGIDGQLEELGVNSADFHYRRKDFTEPNTNVLLVTHAGVIGTVITWLLHNEAFPEDIWHRYPMAFGGVSRLSLTPAGERTYKWQLDFHNYTSHLGEPPWVTETVHGERRR